MKKILILSDTGETSIDLVPRLKELFPECEIQILKCQSKSIEEVIISETMGFQNEIHKGKTVT